MNQTLIAGMDRNQRIALIVGVVGLLLCGIGFLLDSVRAFESYLFAFLFWAGISLGCLAVLALQFIVKSEWGLVTRRWLEAGAMTILPMAALFIPVLFGMRWLYPWANPDVVSANAVLQHKSAYLNIPFFMVRAVVYFGVWSGLAYALRRWSARMDAGDDIRPFRRLQQLSIVGALALSLTVTFAMIDWVMSLEPQWSSTIYAAMVAMGSFLAALALIVALVTHFQNIEPLRTLVTPAVLNDLGNLLLTALLGWAYLAFSQYLVIWTGNLSDEIPWYLRRLENGWQAVALILVVLHFVVPFVLLLSPRVKRSAGSLKLVAALVFVMHLIDVFWLVIPALRPNGLAVSWTDIAAPVGIGGLWVAVFVWQLKQAPLLSRSVADNPPHPQEATVNG